MSEMIVTGKVRFSFVNVFTPRANQEGQEPKYSVTLLIPKTDVDTLNRLRAGMQQAINEGLSKVFGGQMPANPSYPIYDGDGLRPTGEAFGPECKGHYVITASSKQQPQVVDANVQPVLNQSDIYSGCYGRASVRFFAYNKAGRKGVGCGLGNIQKLEDGEALGGRTTAADDFGGARPTMPIGQYTAPGAIHPPVPTQPMQQQVPTQPITAPMAQYGVTQSAPMSYAQPPQSAIDPLTGLPLTGAIMGVG